MLQEDNARLEGEEFFCRGVFTAARFGWEERRVQGRSCAITRVCVCDGVLSHIRTYAPPPLGFMWERAFGKM